MISETIRERARDAAFDFLFWCEHRRKPTTFTPRPTTRKGDNTQDVIAWLRVHPASTIEQMIAGTGLRDRTVRGIVNRNPDKIEQAGALPRVGKAPPVKLWRIREEVRSVG